MCPIFNLVVFSVLRSFSVIRSGFCLAFEKAIV
jgi:hypothetical protein